MKKILQISAILIVFLPLGAFARNLDDPVVVQRNSIDSSGDDAFNLIATSGAEIIIYLDKNNQLIRRNKAELLSEIAKENPDIRQSMRKIFTNESKDFIETIILAEYSFEEGQYSTASVLYDKVLELLPQSHENYEEIRGKVTASLYGSKRHLSAR